MKPELWSVAALVFAIGLSCVSRVNIGLIGMALAWLVGVYAGKIGPEAVLAGFPGGLFVTLVGLTLFFALADANGTLEALAVRAVRLCGRRTALLPVLFFITAAALSTVGPGPAAVAVMAPLAIPIALRVRVSPLLASVMICTGVNAGALSPVSTVGVVVRGLLERIGLVSAFGRAWAAVFTAHTLVALVTFLALGRWWRTREAQVPDAAPEPAPNPLHWKQWATLAAVAVWVVLVMIFRMHVGLSALGIASVLILTGVGDERAAVRQMPWQIILMISGVTLLVALVEKTGGLTLFTQVLAQSTSARSINGAIAFVTGAVSTYSSTSGVVLPAFLPMIPGLVQQIPGAEPLPLALSILVGSALVDVSPLSPIGALCVASIKDPDQSRDAYRRLLLFGLLMTLVGALLAQLCAGPFSR